MNRAQGAIEYLLIIAAAILVVAIVILAVTGALGGGQVQTSQGVTSANNAFDSLKASNSNYIKMSNNYYLKSGNIMDSVVAFYDFEDNSLENKFGVANTATCVGCTFENGLFNSKAIIIPGTLTFGTTTDFGLVDKFTIIAWVKYNGSGILQSIAYANNSFWLRINGIINYPDPGWNVSESFSFWQYDFPPIIYNGWEPGIHSLVRPAENSWHQVVAVYDKDDLGDNVIKIFVNGELKANSSRGSNKGQIAQNDMISSTWRGAMDEIVIFNRALSDTEIKQIYENAIE